MSEIGRYILSELRESKEMIYELGKSIKRTKSENRCLKWCVCFLGFNLVLLAKECGAQKQEIKRIKENMTEGE